MSASVALILAAGGNIGKAVATKLASEGYKIAVASRSGTDPTQGKAFAIKADVSKEEDVVAAFAQTKTKFGAAPNIVIYNAAALTPPPVQDDPFSVPYTQFHADLVTGAVGVHGAIHQAVTGFQTLPANVPKVFIATSNIFGVSPAVPVPLFHTISAQKRLLAYLLEAGAVNPSYKAKGYQFYLAAQVGAEGQVALDEFSGEPHAVAYWNLVNQKEQGRWDYRFIKDGSVYKGY